MKTTDIMQEKLALKELLVIATNEEPSNALMQQLVLLAFDAGKLHQLNDQDEELRQFKNQKNWTRPYNYKGELLNKHALFLPKIKE